MRNRFMETQIQGKKAKLFAKGRDPKNQDFVCAHCHAFVSAAEVISGVQHRNHCPYCLWSRHLDLYQAGDRLAACKAAMKPVGLALKRTHKKYGPGQSELMLVHQCVECGKLSMNRLAADDDIEAALQAYETSLHAIPEMESGIQPLGIDGARTVYEQLFGRSN